MKFLFFYLGQVKIRDFATDYLHSWRILLLMLLALWWWWRGVGPVTVVLCRSIPLSTLKHSRWIFLFFAIVSWSLYITLMIPFWNKWEPRKAFACIAVVFMFFFLFPWFEIFFFPVKVDGTLTFSKSIVCQVLVIFLKMTM